MTVADSTRPESGAPLLAIYSPIFSSADGTHGGITSVILGLLDGLAEFPIKITLLVRASAITPREHALVPANVHMHCIGKHSRWREKNDLKQWLREHAPAALLTAGSRFNLVGIDAAHATGVPVVASVHIHLSRQLANRSALGRWQRLRQIRASYPMARATIAVSAGVAADLRASLGNAGGSIVTIPNPVLLRSSEVSRTPPDHPWLTKSRDRPVILAAGRLTEQKDYPTLLDAFARLRAGRDCRLIVLGEGEARTALEQRLETLGIKDSVDLPGFRANVLSWMRAADVFVLSSAWEGFGNVLVEALSMGVPVVSTDCDSGPREVLQDGSIGPLVPVGDSNSLAEAIARTLDTPPDRLLLTKAAEPYRSDRIARRYLEVLGMADLIR